MNLCVEKASNRERGRLSTKELVLAGFSSEADLQEKM
jgi:hypothetical protein